MRKNKRTQKKQCFEDFLLRQAPHYDQAILQDVAKQIKPIKRDLRLLSCRSERMLLRMVDFEDRDLRSISRQWHWRRSKLVKFYTRTHASLIRKVELWISKLPKYKQEAERQKRLVLNNGWIGQVATSEYHVTRFRANLDKLFPSWEPVIVVGNDSESQVKPLPKHKNP